MQLKKQARRIRRHQLNAATLTAASALQLSAGISVALAEVEMNGGQLGDVPGYPEWEAAQEKERNRRANSRR